MSASMLYRFKISFCMSTRNRAHLIGATLDSILSQATPDCEIVVVDGASTDDTERVVSRFVERHENVRYFKQEKNGGVDRDFDRAVELARGEHCWLLPDDDLLKPGAIRSVLDALDKDYFLVLVNLEQFDATRLNVITPTMLSISENRIFSPQEAGALFKECFALLGYIGSFILPRRVWLARNRSRYFGLEFIHVGVIFQEPIPRDVLVIATPLISVRIGNQLWRSRAFEIWTIKWPSLVRSLALPDSAKLAATQYADGTMRSFSSLLWYRAISAYSLEIYRCHARPQLARRLERILPIMVAVMPGAFANTCYILLTLFRNRKRRTEELPWLRRSPYCLKWWRIT